MSNNAKASKAVNVLLDIARTEFGEPNGAPEHYRFSIGPDHDRLEIMHGKRAPLEWRSVVISLDRK